MTVIYENLIKGSHNVLILEYDNDANFFLEPKEAFSNLLLTEGSQKRNVIMNQHLQ